MYTYYGYDFNRYNSNELCHYGVLGMKWGKRKARPESGTYTTSNGTKIAAPKNGYVKALRKVTGNMSGEAMDKAYRKVAGKNNAVGERQVRKEHAAIREYNAHQKDLRRGTGDKYLNKAIRENKLDNAYREVKKSSSKVERMIFKNSVRKKAAKYVVDNNMSVKDAKKKANRRAVAQTAAYLAAAGALEIGFHAVKR